MEKIEKDILTTLLEKYENSKLSKGETKVRRTIKITPKDKALSTYSARDSYKYADDNDKAIKNLERRGFISAKFEYEVFSEAVLNLEKVEEIYEYIQRPNPKEELSNIKTVINESNYDERIQPFLAFVCDSIEKKDEYPKRYFADANELKLILKTIDELLCLEGEMREREFSARYLGDSKKFVTIKNKVISIARDFIFESDDDDNTILFRLNISKNSTYAIIKNKLLFELGDVKINLNKFNYEFCLSDEMIKDIKLIESDIKTVMTVENLTSFHSLNDRSSLIVYLAGFHNHTKQLLLEKIYQAYPKADYYHFGDIDAGGFWIFENLRSKTGIDFKPYRMNIDELACNTGRLKKLTSNDIKRLEKMLNDDRFSVFKETIQFMLKNNVKLEQELLD